MLTLHLIRHAKTHQSSQSGRDFDRELMEKGIAQANLLGSYMQLHHIEPGDILCSAACRTRQTHAIVCRHISEKCPVEIKEELYHASKERLLEELAKQTARTVTIIGHNEGISNFASHLSDERLDMKTCELITLSFAFNDWNLVSGGTGIISLRYRPEVFLP
jgi:phosphohistidine phosphatase